MYPRFILDRQLFPRNAVNSWRRSTRTRTRGDGQTDPRSPYPYGVNYRPSNRIDVKDLRRVVLPAYSVSAYLYGFLSASSAREREREKRDLSFRQLSPRRKLFEKSSRCISVRYWTISPPPPPPSILFLFALFVYSRLSARFKPDRRNDLWRRKADTADSVLLLLLLLDTDSNYSPSGKTSPTVIPKRDISLPLPFSREEARKT